MVNKISIADEEPDNMRLVLAALFTFARIMHDGGGQAGPLVIETAAVQHADALLAALRA